MADRIRKAGYCYITVSPKSGSGARVLGALKDAGVDLLGFSGFPAGAGKAQLDFITDDIAAVRRAARKYGWRVSPTKKGFLVQGKDRPGAVHKHLRRLADARVSVTAAQGVSSGNGRFGMLLWVKPKDFNRAAKALGAR